MALLDFLFGSRGRTEQLPTMNPAQQALLGQLIGQLQRGPSPLMQQGLGYLGNILGQSPEAMAAYERPALRQFKEQLVPELAERFAGTGALSSSAFPMALSQGAAGLAENLQAQRAGLQGSALQQLLGIENAPYERAQGLLSHRPFGYREIPGTPGLIPQFGSSLVSAYGGSLGRFLGGGGGFGGLGGLGSIFGFGG